MRVLLVTQNFYPENFKSNDIAFELRRRGYDVDVLTGIPNYPEGRYPKGYGIFRKRKEIIDGVRIYRAFQIPRGKNVFLLFLEYLSFWFCGNIWAFCLAAANRYDCVFVHQPSPITQAFPGIWVSRLQNIPLYLWVLDVWPESATSFFKNPPKLLSGILERLTRRVYKESQMILISSEGFAPMVNRLGDFSDKIEYFPNWSPDFRGLEERATGIVIPSGFVVMMAGNLGFGQDIPTVLKAIKELKNQKDIVWVFVGGGTMKGEIDKFIETEGLDGHVITTGRMPADKMPAIYSRANVMLITLRSSYEHLAAVVPARFMSYLSVGKPILGMIDGGTAELIKRYNCGGVVPAGDYQGLSTLIERFSGLTPEQLNEMGDNARDAFEKYYTLPICIDHLEDILNKGR